MKKFTKHLENAAKQWLKHYGYEPTEIADVLKKIEQSPCLNNISLDSPRGRGVALDRPAIFSHYVGRNKGNQQGYSDLLDSLRNLNLIVSSKKSQGVMYESTIQVGEKSIDLYTITGI